jgi:hypothetical protein
MSPSHRKLLDQGQKKLSSTSPLSQNFKTTMKSSLIIILIGANFVVALWMAAII